MRQSKVRLRGRHTLQPEALATACTEIRAYKLLTNDRENGNNIPEGALESACCEGCVHIPKRAGIVVWTDRKSVV